MHCKAYDMEREAALIARLATERLKDYDRELEAHRRALFGDDEPEEADDEA